MTSSSPGAVHVALGPAGKNIIETISTVDGTSNVSPPYSGEFNSWFVDGGRFLTNQSTMVWVYSNTGVNQAVTTLPTIAGLSGTGNWIWTYDSQSFKSPFDIYAIGAGTPAMTVDSWGGANIMASGSSLGILSYTPNVTASGGVALDYQFSVIDLQVPAR